MENITPKPNALSVSKLNKYIKRLLEDDFVLKEIFVNGEISNLKKHSSGHFYFTLKDSKAQINAVMFKSYTSSLDFNLENGMNVVCFGYVSMYEVTGQFQLYVEMIVPIGAGSLNLKYEELKNKLEKKGYFDLEHKKEIPLYPSVVAVLTADTGAAVKDIIRTISRRNPTIKIVVVPTIVQGVNSKKSIIENIKNVNTLKDEIDVIILGRGGGSIEDLWSFNEEEVCKSIYQSKIPIISAVGHETDFTLADFVADKRASTPSTAGEMVSTPLYLIENCLEQSSNDMLDLLNQNISKKRAVLNNLVNSNVLKRPELLILNEEKRLSNLIKLLNSNIELKLNIARNKLSHQTIKLESNSPLRILNNGYTLTYKDDKLITKSVDLTKDDLITVKFSDGTISAKVR